MPLIEQKTLSPHSGIYIWQVTEEEQELMDAYRPDEPEKALLNSFTHTYRRRQYLATRLLIRCLGNDIRIRYDDYGKPYISKDMGTETLPHISISHSGEYIVLLTDHKSCGVDIETVRPKIERIAAKFLCEEELRFALREPFVERLHVYWCVKEALYKVYGKKNVSLRSNIFVNEAGDSIPGETLATLRHEDVLITRKIRFERFRECMLAWSTDTET